jgi:hypothetical protein
LELVAGEQIVSVADACGFSEPAHAKGVRLGWCRFDMGGLFIAGALNGMVNLRCAVSGNLIEAFNLAALAPAPTSRPFLSLSELRAYISELSGCSDLHQIAPLAEWYRRQHGDRSFVGASYLYLHNRQASGEEIDSFLHSLPSGWGIMDCWEKITSSPEYMRRTISILPGVFSPGFPFGLELLGLPSPAPVT